jgi:hypothetical protein
MANEYGIGFWGQNSWGENSDVFVSLTGQQLNSSSGTVTTTTEINTGWGRLGWGVQDWGTTGISVSTTLTGSQINLSLGNETVGIVTIASPNGNALAFALSGVDPSPDAFASGTQLPIQVGSPFTIADSNVSVTGNEITLGLGTAQSSALTIASPSGLGLVTPAPGTVVVGGIANVPVSGNELTAATGEVDVAPDVALTGQQINVTTGTVVADAVTFASVTGLGLNTTTGTVSFTITGSVLLTGNQLNIALGNEVSQVWTIVDTGTTVAYTEVSTGSSVNWNIIDTAA